MLLDEIKEIISTETLPFGEIYQQVENYKKDSKDYLAPLSQLRLNNHASLTDTTHKLQDFNLTDWSSTQLANKLGIPSSYLKKCIRKGQIKLAQDNVNTWIINSDKSSLLRTYKDNLIGIVSDRYSIMDNTHLLDCLQDSLNLDSYNIKGSITSPERLHLRLVEKELLDIPNEDLFAGLLINNSNVGRSCLTVRFIIFKQVCTNGLVLPQESSILFKQKHMGIKVEDFRECLQTNLKLIPKLVNEATKMIKSTINHSLNKDDLVNLIEKIKKDTSLSDEHLDTIVNMLDFYGYNTWGVINGLTQVSRDFTLEKRLELEKYAGSMLIA